MTQKTNICDKWKCENTFSAEIAKGMYVRDIVTLFGEPDHVSVVSQNAIRW